MNESTATASNWAVITDFSADIDLTTHAKGNKSAARAIQILSAGAGRLYVIKATGDGVNAREDLTGLTAGFLLQGQVKIIKKTLTTVAGIIVYW